jgi:hypothetical protein
VKYHIQYFLLFLFFSFFFQIRVMKQFHFTEWTCHSCPFPSALLEFRRRIRHYLKTLGVHQTSSSSEGQQQQPSSSSSSSSVRKPSINVVNETGQKSQQQQPVNSSTPLLGPAASSSNGTGSANNLQLAQTSRNSVSSQNLLQVGGSGGGALGRRSSSVYSTAQVFVPGPAEELGGPLIVHCKSVNLKFASELPVVMKTSVLLCSFLSLFSDTNLILFSFPLFMYLWTFFYPLSS